MYLYLETVNSFSRFNFIYTIVFMIKKHSLFHCIILLSCLSIKAQNLINNGDFESGSNGVGFSINSSLYHEITPPFSGTTVNGDYAVTNNPQAMNTTFAAGGDHTSGTGNMLVVDGTATGGNQRFWRAGNNGGGICNLTLGTTYTFSYWIKSLSIQNRANIGYQFVGANNVTLVAGNALAPLPIDGWQRVAYTFIPSNNCVNFELFDTTTTSIGNDFAVDDFSLIGPPLPLTLSYSKVNPSCNNTSDGSIIGYGAGASPPYVFTLVGPNGTVINDSGIFTGLASGNYSLQILEGADGQITINNIILTNPPSLTVSNPATICSGANTTLSVSGGSGYTWTASPSDSTLTTPTSPNPIVQPAQTTTYTVTSSNSSNDNLIYNGDFSLGNLGFLTDYVYYNPNNPSAVQRAYGITTNSNSWSNFFSNCTDHTLGTGNMMVVDGSNVNSGNDKLWCQTVAVTPNQNYTFQYWIQTVALPTPANIAVIINGVSVGIQTAPATTCNWQLRSYNWNSGSNTTAQICLYDRETTATGNDFAIDDIRFTGPPSACNSTASVTITVNPGTVPDFPTTMTLCNGIPAPILPATSPNGISGIWTPAIVSNTVSGVYTFQPNPNQCATSTTLEVGINNAFTPTFNTINPICAGTTLSPLPIISTNNIVGVWTPSFNNTTSTTYTFTPTPGQCAAPISLQLTVIPSITPTFSPVGPYCSGKVISDPLPLFSMEGISGSWTPLYDSMATTTYTFIPNPNQCATTTTLEVVIIPANIFPTFSIGPNITTCYAPIDKTPVITLPTTSDNGIPGIWNPDFIDTTILGTTIYTFTAIANTCVANYELTVTIIGGPEFKINAGCDGTDFVLSTNVAQTENTTFTWYNSLDEVIATTSSVIITETGDYQVVVLDNGCYSEQEINIPVIYCKIPRGISPNTDNLNDFFDLSNLNVQKLQIYNRYGTEVYSKSGYKKEWEGTTNSGTALPDGTYYYVINFETGKAKTGWVYINK